MFFTASSRVGSNKKKTYDGYLKDIDEKFLWHTAVFVEGLVSPENIVKKTINGKVVDALAILKYILDCTKIISNGKLPDSSRMTEILVEAQNLEAQKTCAESYRQVMKKCVGNEYPKEAILMRMHRNARLECLDLFRTETRFGSEESRAKHRDYLEESIEREYDALCQRNRRRKCEAGSKLYQAVNDLQSSLEKIKVERTSFLDTTATSKYGKQEKPYAITILECIDNKFEIKMENLIKLFRRPEIQDKPISIVSIAGAFRGGKSFMLNFFLRYLRRKECQYKNWIGNPDEPMSDGFEWRGGSEACTNGIQIWSEVFYINQGGRKVAIMLMDTQGLFDNKTESKTNSIISALSTLISSVQIFNLSKQIQTSDLEFLRFFTEYAKAASDQGHSGKPFQTLLFLIRDWQNADELEYGMKGGYEYLMENLYTESSSQKLSSVQKYLTSSFSDTKCFLLPHPGSRFFGKKSLEGRLKDIDEEFLEHTAAFVEGLFRPENIVKKIINGKVVYATTILQYISDYCETFKNGKLPDPKTMTETLADAQNLEAQRTCFEHYRQIMKMNVGDEYVEEALLLKMHRNARLECLNLFRSETKFGSEESRAKHRDYLEALITHEYDALCISNKCKKAMRAQTITQQRYKL